MADTKWADVAHYYSRSPITLVDDIGDIYDCSIAVSLGYLYRWKPILRHLEDMTEDECFELAALIWGDSDLIPFTRSKSHRIIKHKDIKFNQSGDPYGDCLFVVGIEGRASSWPIRMNQMTPLAIHWLISRGFDMYKLIESGQAIRKEAGNG